MLLPQIIDVTNILVQEPFLEIKNPDSGFVTTVIDAQGRLSAIRRKAPGVDFEDYWEMNGSGHNVLVGEWYEESAKIQQDIVRFLFATEGDNEARIRLGASLKMFWLESEDHAKRLESSILQYRFMKEVRRRGHYCELPDPALDAHNGIDILAGVPYFLPRTGIDIKFTRRLHRSVILDNSRYVISEDLIEQQRIPLLSFDKHGFSVIPVADSAGYPRYVVAFQRPSDWQNSWKSGKFTLKPLRDSGKEYDSQIVCIVDWMFGREEIIGDFDLCEICSAVDYVDGPCGGECPTISDILKNVPELQTEIIFPKSLYEV